MTRGKLAEAAAALEKVKLIYRSADSRLMMLAPLREAAALAVARAAPAEASRLLAPLAGDPAPSVSRTVRALLARSAPRASA